MHEAAPTPATTSPLIVSPAGDPGRIAYYPRGHSALEAKKGKAACKALQNQELLRQISVGQQGDLIGETNWGAVSSNKTDAQVWPSKLPGWRESADRGDSWRG